MGKRFFRQNDPKIEKIEKRIARLKSTRKKESVGGTTFHFRAWEGKNTHNPIDLDQDDQALSIKIRGNPKEAKLRRYSGHVCPPR